MNAVELVEIVPVGVARIMQLGASSFRILDRTDPREGGSCIAVTIGDHYFFATAAHVVPDNHEVGILLHQSSEEVREFVARHRDEDADVALLEIGAADASRFGAAFIGLEKIHRSMPVEGEDVFVTGYPGKYMKPIGRRVYPSGRVSMYYAVVPSVLVCTVLPTDDAGNGTEMSPASAHEVLLDFDPSDEQTAFPMLGQHAPIKFNEAYPEPHGLSGGGVWRIGKQANSAIWTPKMELVAIQHSWNRDTRKLRGTHLNRWLDLVGAHYPDLRKQIAKGAVA